jgi:anti-sigma regulatory factor (Ser/Thr protein kinase)
MAQKRKMCQLKVEIPATASHVEAFVAGLRARLECLSDDTARFAAELLLRESLANAVSHGCRENVSRNVQCALRIRERALTIVVRDDGGGFDWHTRQGREAGPAQASGRGLEIIRRYATRVRFNRCGNTVSILKRW